MWFFCELPSIKVSIESQDHIKGNVGAHTVGAVNHDSQLLLLVLQGLLGSLDVLLVKVGSLGTTSQDNEAVLVTLSAGDSGKTLLGDTHEVMLGSGSANGVNGNAETTVCAVLEADGERQTRGQLTVKLGLGGSGTDGTDRDTVGKELGGDGIEHFRSNWHSSAGEVDKELSRNSETLVNLERVVDIRVVNQTLPANSCPGLLEVGTHHNAEVVRELVRELLELSSVLVGGGRVVDGAGAYDDEKSVASAQDDVGGIVTALDDCVGSGLGERNLGGEESRRDQRILSEDWGELAN